MTILHRILTYDMHRQKSGLGQGQHAVPLMLEIPASKNFLPCVISTTRGKFIYSNKLTNEQKIRVGLFEYDTDYIDNLISDMMDSAFLLSKSNSWGNIFIGSSAPKSGFDYIKRNSNLIDQPHVCLIPENWNDKEIFKWFKRNLSKRELKGEVVLFYRKICEIVKCKISFPVFCSRSDYVGMYTHFLGTNSGVLLHNVRLGLAFCPM